MDPSENTKGVGLLDAISYISDILLRASSSPPAFLQDLTALKGKLGNERRERLKGCFADPSSSRVLTELVRCGVPAELRLEEDTGLTTEHFRGCAERAATVLECLNILLSSACVSAEPCDEVKTTLLTVSPDLLHLISGNIPRNLWTSKKSEQQAKLALKNLKRVFHVESCGQLLLMKSSSSVETETVYDQFLNLTQRSLSRDQWKNNPFCKASFCWLLLHLTFPNLSHFLNQVLPFPLNMVDDFNLENKILGIRCLHHIMENVSREELRWYGRAEVVYEALRHQLYTKHAAMIDVLHPALLRVLSTVEGRGSSGQCRDTNRCDEVLRMILLDAQMENNLVIRRALTRHLPDFIRLLGISSVRHMKSVLELVSSYLQIYDGPQEVARLNSLQCLEALLLITWPRVPAHAARVLKLLLRFLYDVSTDQTVTPDSVKSEMVSAATKCLHILQRAAPDMVHPALLEVSTTDTVEQVKDIALSVCASNLSP